MSLKETLYELTKNMPKDKALDFIDKYKDNLKYSSLSEKRRKAMEIGEIIKNLKILK